MKDLASRLRLARAASGLSLADATARLEEDPENEPIAYRAMLAWEDGRLQPRPEYVRRLAAIYGCSPTWLRSGRSPDESWDGCEVALDGRPGVLAPNTSALHHVTHAARWVVGDQEWRLCDACAAHPTMRKVKPRKRIKPERES